MTPLVVHPDRSLILPPRLFGSVGYYALMARYGHVTVDTSMRYDKRHKAVHRYDIVDTRGPVTLTVPLAKPHGTAHPTWADAAVSTHDQWWHQHRVTLESAYGRTPYFEFLIDRFAPLIADPSGTSPWPSALGLAGKADAIVREFLGFDNCVKWQAADQSGSALDLRHASFDVPSMPHYRQLRSAKLGFIPDLSILDIIFNLGPESVFFLKRLGDFIQQSSCKPRPQNPPGSPAGQS
ncbi:MAG: WbqC family protein [Muribaculaceae bacterium]|nr:WbqC family protein [Muribaculaceae bacterium]